ncbi:hypothetical protein HDU79_003452 [Rhizoclosmatium sp. JEL0117]|nr:hypothetical protein HDU79_003452 [Rhizoclosmatium sp. JEL0117]
MIKSSELPSYAAPVTDLPSTLLFSQLDKHTVTLNKIDDAALFSINLKFYDLNMFILHPQTYTGFGTTAATKIKFSSCAPSVTISRTDGSTVAEMTPFDFDNDQGYTVRIGGDEYKINVEAPRFLKSMNVKELCSFIGPKGSYHWRTDGIAMDITALEDDAFVADAPMGVKGLAFALHFTPHNETAMIQDSSLKKSTFSFKNFLGKISGGDGGRKVAKMVVDFKNLQTNGVLYPAFEAVAWKTEEECVLLAASALAAQFGLRYRLFTRFLNGYKVSGAKNFRAMEFGGAVFDS